MSRLDNPISAGFGIGCGFALFSIFILTVVPLFILVLLIMLGGM